MAENKYNWDKKGSLIRFGHAVKQIMICQGYEQGHIKAAKQDGSREFIRLLATIECIFHLLSFIREHQVIFRIVGLMY